jgi:hypothetical protein
VQDNAATYLNSPGWLLFVKISFVASVLAMTAGIVLLPTDFSIKGFFAMGTLYLIGSTFTLSKTIRDEFESHKLINRIADAKAQQILKEYDT